MGIGLVDFVSSIYYFTRMESIDENIRAGINGSEAAVNNLVSTTPAIDRAIAEYRESNRFSQMIEDMNNNEQAVLEMRK